MINHIDSTLSDSSIHLSLQEVHKLKKKAVKGVFVLGIRRLITQIIITIGSVIIARLLFPKDFGIFAIIAFFINLFTIIADVGLGAAIIQKERDASREELQSIFTTQIILGIFASLLMYALSPLLALLYKNQLGSSALFFLQISSLAILINNLKIIPASLLERSINYGKILIADVIELLLLQGITIGLALQGFGFASFVWALIISRLLSAILLFLLNPWQIGFRFSVKDLSNFFSFGFSYQLNSIVFSVIFAFAPIVVGGIRGTTALGLVNWAIGVALFPRIFSDILNRLIFPVCVSAREDSKLLKSIIEQAAFINSFLSFPVIAILIVLAKPVTLIVFTDKWEDGISSLCIFSLAAAMLLISELFQQTLFALGKAQLVRNINLFFMGILWIVGTVLVYFIGYVGYPIAWLIASITFIIPLWNMYKLVRIRVIKDFIINAALSIVVGVCIWGVSLYYPITNIWKLIGMGGSGYLFYLILGVLFRRKKIVQTLKSLAVIIHLRFT